MTLPEISDRQAIRTGWALMAQWWCLPIDASLQEEEDFLRLLREDLGADFAACPLDYIRDRLFGGFYCDAPQRAHIFFAVAYYSFTAAEEGRYWALDQDRRQEIWHKLLENNRRDDRGGPFCADYPSQA